MRLRTTLILLLVLIGLGAYVYLVERPAAEEEARSKKLLDFDKDQIVELALVYEDREMHLAKTDDEWTLEKPLEARADASSVNSLLNTLANAEVDKQLEDVSANLGSYGLDTPLVTVRMKTKDAELAAVSVGKDTPFGSSTYTRRAEEDNVLITTSSLRYAVDKQVKDLRDKTIVRFEDDDVRQIDIRGTEKHLRLERKDGQWNLVEPASLAADQSAVRSYLSSLRSMRATDFPADAVEDLILYGLDEPRLTVTLVLQDGNETRVLLGDEAEESNLYVKLEDRPTVFTVSDYVFGNLDKDANDLRDKTLLAFESDAVSAVQITRQDGSVTRLRRENGGPWTVEGDDAKPATSAIDQYVDDVQQLKGYEIAADDPADLAEFGLDNPLLSVQLSGADGVDLGTIVIGRYDGDDDKSYAAMRRGGNTVFRVREYLVTRVDKPHSTFVETPEETPAAEAS